MTSHGLITDAENAIATGRQHAAVSRTDQDHEAAVELMQRGLLVDRKVVERELRDRLAVEATAAIAAHKAEFPGLFMFRAGMHEVLRMVIGPDVIGAVQVDIDGSPGDLFDPCDPAGGGS